MDLCRFDLLFQSNASFLSDPFLMIRLRLAGFQYAHYRSCAVGGDVYCALAFMFVETKV
jgi:hypothetical protein